MIVPTPLGAAIDAFEAAVRERSQSAEEAFRRVGEALSGAGAEESAAAGPRLAALIPDVPPGPVAHLAVFVGACVERGADPVACAGPVMEGLRQTLRGAVDFAGRWGDDLPDPQSVDLDDAVVERLGGGEAIGAALAWWTLEPWEMAAVAMLSHGSVRRTLTGRDELVALANRIAEATDGELKCLRYSLLVLDDEPLVVLHRPSGTGYRLRMSGIGDNFQLHTLLAHALIGPGRLAGEPPSPQAVAACLTGDMSEDERVNTVGAFNLVSPDGEWIWNEGTPSDIPLVDGVRLLVLDPPPYQRGWPAGRFFPNMAAELTLEGALSAEESRTLLAGVSAPSR
ncbi:hypothetical protein SRB5_31330 [Streptomyces sp. RB5]|uniref:Uncharacterized protein n=1 Tax=Streptomyces smaragdinus TaxID=2585196 RepID=A0A7K0CI33_9ACTN|nr:hypothetical protein [Streptomyces smaragdinus]MQY12993.1 hypothetical protein [Streptomyces smaragdinus]